MSDNQTYSFNLTQRPFKDNQIDYLHAGKQKQKVTETMHMGKQGMLMISLQTNSKQLQLGIILHVMRFFFTAMRVHGPIDCSMVNGK